MADALSDIVTFANAVGGMTDSFARLYDMKTRMRAERVEAEISRKEVEFLDRMRLPFGADGRITTDNFRDELTKHETEIDSYVGRIDEEGVRARVSNSVQGGRSRFHETIMSQYYPKYVEEAQVEWSAGAKIDSDTFFKLPEGARTREVAGEYIKKIESGLASGLFDPAKAEEIRGKMSGYYYGIASADEKLAEAKGDFDDALILASSGIGNDEERKVALSEIARKQAEAEQVSATEVTRLIASDPMEALSYAEKMRGGLAFKATEKARIVDAVVKKNIITPEEFVSDIIASIDRSGDVTNSRAVSVFTQAKKHVEDWYNSMPDAARADKRIVDQYTKQIERLDEKVSNLSQGRADSAEWAKSRYGTLLDAFLTNNVNSDTGKMVTYADLWSAMMIVNKYDATAASTFRNDLMAGKVYERLGESDKALAEALKSTSVENAIKNIVFGKEVIEGLDKADSDALKSYFAKPSDKNNAGTAEKMRVVGSDILSELSVWLSDGPRKSASDIINKTRELVIPHLTNFEYVNVQPMIKADNSLSGVREWQDAVDSGALEPLYIKSPVTGRTSEPVAYSKLMAARNDFANKELERLSSGGVIPGGYKLQPAEKGDLWITGPDPNVKYGVDAGATSDLSIYRYEKGDDGSWVRKEEMSSILKAKVIGDKEEARKGKVETATGKTVAAVAKAVESGDRSKIVLEAKGTVASARDADLPSILKSFRDAGMTDTEIRNAGIDPKTGKRTGRR